MSLKKLLLEVDPEVYIKFKTWCILQDISMKQGFHNLVSKLEVVYNDGSSEPIKEWAIYQSR